MGKGTLLFSLFLGAVFLSGPVLYETWVGQDVSEANIKENSVNSDSKTKCFLFFLFA